MIWLGLGFNFVYLGFPITIALISDARLHHVLAARNVQDDNHDKQVDLTFYAGKGLKARIS